VTSEEMRLRSWGEKAQGGVWEGDGGDGGLVGGEDMGGQGVRQGRVEGGKRMEEGGEGMGRVNGEDEVGREKKGLEGK